MCDRSAAIHQAIVDAINEAGIAEISLCSEVTDDHLAAISSLVVDPDDGLSRPKAGDLAGLTGLTTVNLSNSPLRELPAGFFADSTNLQTIRMAISKLEGLPAGIFDGLSGLTTLDLNRNLFGDDFPPGLTTLTNANHPNLSTVILGLDYPDPVWHFIDLPSGWVQNLPTGLTTLELKHIGLTDAEAVWVATNLTDLDTLTFSHRKMTLPKFSETIEQLRINSSPGGLTNLTLAASGDRVQNCVTIENSNSLGDLYSAATQTEKDAFEAAFTGFIVDNLTIWDPTMTAEVLDVILNSMGVGSGDKTLHFECADLEGFTGASLSKYTNLKRLEIKRSGLTTADFISIVENLEPTPIYALELQSNDFRDIDLADFMFSGILDTLRKLDFSRYESCEGPWIEDYQEAGFNLSAVTVEPTPKEEPEVCVPPPTPDPATTVITPKVDRGRILRIEPAVKGIRVWTETELVLSTNVYGVQDLLDNALADQVSADEVRFDWEDTLRGGRISEEANYPLRQNSKPDDRKVRYTSPRIPGTYVVIANIPHSHGCRGPRGDETAADAEARCTAEFEIVVRQQTRN